MYVAAAPAELRPGGWSVADGSIGCAAADACSTVCILLLRAGGAAGVLPPLCRDIAREGGMPELGAQSRNQGPTLAFTVRNELRLSCTAVSLVLCAAAWPGRMPKLTLSCCCGLCALC